MQIKSVAKTVLEYLREQIITGGLEPGQKLNESELASRLEISRHPLREAFRILEKERLVQSIPRRGTYVTKISQEDFQNLSKAREILECNAIEILKDVEKKDLSKMAQAVETADKEAVPSEYDVGQYLKCHRIVENFHFQLIASTDNSWVIHFYKSFYGCISRYQFICLREIGVIEDSIKEHRKIYEAIKNNNYENAQKMLRSHIYKQKC